MLRAESGKSRTHSSKQIDAFLPCDKKRAARHLARQRISPVGSGLLGNTARIPELFPVSQFRPANRIKRRTQELCGNRKAAFIAAHERTDFFVIDRLLLHQRHDLFVESRTGFHTEAIYKPSPSFALAKLKSKAALHLGLKSVIPPETDEHFLRGAILRIKKARGLECLHHVEKMRAARWLVQIVRVVILSLLHFLSGAQQCAADPFAL